MPGDQDWDPTVLNVNIDNDESFFDAISDEIDPTSHFDFLGNYKHRRYDVHTSSPSEDTPDTYALDVFWFYTQTPDQALCSDIEEEVIICSEHASFSRYFDIDDDAAVFVCIHKLK